MEQICVCIPILVTTFPEWLNGMEPLPYTPSPVRASSLCLVFCVHIYSFAGFDKADATADIQ